MFILGKKLNMSQIWKEGRVIPVTLVEVSKNKVSLIRTKEKDGYEAVQLKFGKKSREFKFAKSPSAKKEDYQAGNDIDVSAFKEGDVVRVSGVSKGRGFQGVVKRHGFGGGPKTHGQKNRFRAPGSIGSTAPQKVFPGRKMAGRMGNDRVTVKNLKVAGIDAKKNILMIKGAVPGVRGGLLEIQKV
ncbi:MAG: 50S ribosomal protein L3 [Candidatus Liptonbacteria bacterium]|nr:50S ribosomal protein L3 [Candidatus Liptonbacteria bacterium]